MRAAAFVGGAFIGGALAFGAGAPPTARAQPIEVPATLIGHARLPAGAMTPPPSDAPIGFMLSGRFAAQWNRRIETPQTRDARTPTAHPDAPRNTGWALPLVGQPIQGISALAPVGDGSFWALSDNGFGAKSNSADALLMIHRMRPDWESGRVAVEKTITLSDPDRVLPFPIVNEFSDHRYLTGGDLDPEALVLSDDGFWIGDEFGPFLAQLDRAGRVRRIEELRHDGRRLRSPDNPRVAMPRTPGPAAFDISRSRGFEGLGGSVAKSGPLRLYPMLEGPLWRPVGTGAERMPDLDARQRPVVRVFEFDPVDGGYTGAHWSYSLADPDHVVGAFLILSESRALVLERDHGEGDPARACPSAVPRSDCFARPARFKKLFLVDLSAPSGGQLRKLAAIDLLDIRNPDNIARAGGGYDRFLFPFETIESVARVGERRLVIVNDNNFPFSAGRFPDRADDTEWILLDVGDFLTR